MLGPLRALTPSGAVGKARWPGVATAHTLCVNPQPLGAKRFQTFTGFLGFEVLGIRHSAKVYGRSVASFMHSLFYDYLFSEIRGTLSGGSEKTDYRVFG